MRNRKKGCETGIYMKEILQWFSEIVIDRIFRKNLYKIYED